MCWACRHPLSWCHLPHTRRTVHWPLCISLSCRAVCCKYWMPQAYSGRQSVFVYVVRLDQVVTWYERPWLDCTTFTSALPICGRCHWSLALPGNVLQAPSVHKHSTWRAVWHESWHEFCSTYYSGSFTSTLGTEKPPPGARGVAFQNVSRQNTSINLPSVDKVCRMSGKADHHLPLYLAPSRFCKNVFSISKPGMAVCTCGNVIVDNYKAAII